LDPFKRSGQIIERKGKAGTVAAALRRSVLGEQLVFAAVARVDRKLEVEILHAPQGRTNDGLLLRQVMGYH